jgi:hypothetical protein
MLHREVMNYRHAAALAMLGWYLMLAQRPANQG